MLRSILRYRFVYAPAQCMALALVLVAGPLSLRAQNDIENVIVETYYVSDANDATDVDGGALPEGSRTYRVYLDLCSGCSIRSLYGDANHRLSITSTAPFFNHTDRGRTYGHEINNGALDEGTVALDSWITLGASSNQRRGIPKVDDSDGSIIGGANNDGGSAGIPGGLLVNQTPEMVHALTDRDGLAPLGGGVATPPNFNVTGDDPGTVFNAATVASSFISNDVRIGCATPGVQGAGPDNRVLVMQLTTTGELTFELNVEVQRANGSVFRYVANDSILLPDEQVNGALRFPPDCGCTDPNYLEYDPAAGCDDGSCNTTIIFGCLDTLACNFDPDANFNIPQLCCYGPGNCNGLDIAQVCPTVAIDERDGVAPRLSLIPNPAQDRFILAGLGASSSVISCELLDASGRSVRRYEGITVNNGESGTMDLLGLKPGLYLMRAQLGTTVRTERLVIN